MASFQIVYDDFSGGQYMGPKSTNWPKNTFDGTNAMSNPYGHLMPTGGPALAYTATVGTPTSAEVVDQWIIGETLYAFCQWYTGGTYAPRMVSFNVANGTVFPSPTVTTTTLTGTLAGKVAYDNPSTKFFYVRSDGANAGYIRSVTTGGTDASVSTALGGTGITNVAQYGYRLVAWGSTSKRLYYSNTDLTTWSTSNYYEFSGEVLNVLPRSNDLLVIATTGVFSVVGVLGSSVTIQQILPAPNTPEGMRDAVIVGRTAVFCDNSRSGNMDGRIHQLVGTSVQPIANLSFTAIQNVGAVGGYEQVRCFNVQDSGISVILKDGLTLYVRKQDGTWVKFYNTNVSPIVARNATNQIHVARPGVNSQNEYIIAAYVDSDSGYAINFVRAIYGVTDTTYEDHDFRTTSTASGESVVPVGYAMLPEYWHNKPFTVKHLIIEWQGRSGGYVSANIYPTGVIDATGSNVEEGLSETIDTTLNGFYDSFVTERIAVDDASKGMGAKVELTLHDSRVKRVMLMCED